MSQRCQKERGYGVYLAERSTKADEYAEEIHGGLPMDEGCYVAWLASEEPVKRLRKKKKTKKKNWFFKPGEEPVKTWGFAHFW